MTIDTMIGYARVSTEGQESEGSSLDAQRAAIEAYAAAQGRPLRAVFVDVASARSLDRPGLAAALRLAAETVETRWMAGGLAAPKSDAVSFVVVKLDRLTRSVRDLGELLGGPFAPGRGVALVAVRDSIDTSTAAGRLVLHLLGSVAQWEREAIGERTREALAHVRRQGTYLGAPPFGWRAVTRDDGKRVLVEVEHEQRVLVFCRQALSRGMRPAAILRDLRTMEVTTRRGLPWSQKVLGSVIRRIRAERAPFEASQL